ncbi:hypothetical protein ACTJKF_21415 [Burkholderia sp. 22313]
MQRQDPGVVSVLKRQEAMPIRQVPHAARKRANDTALRRWQTCDSRASLGCDLSRIVSIVQRVAGHTIAWGRRPFRAWVASDADRLARSIAKQFAAKNTTNAWMPATSAS